MYKYAKNVKNINNLSDFYMLLWYIVNMFFVKLSIYDIEEINYLERTIEKTKLVSRFKEALAH